MAAKAFKSLILGGGVAANDNRKKIRDASTYIKILSRRVMNESMFRSCAVHKLSLTAPKHHRIRHFAEIVLLQGTVATRSRHISTIGISRATETEPDPIKEAFSKYTSCLDDLNDKRLKIAEVCYGIKEHSRNVIYRVLGINKHNKDEILKQAEKDLAVIVDRDMSRLVKVLQGTDFWLLGQNYSRGIHMYVGAAALCYFRKTGALLDLDEINASLRPLSDSSIELLKISVPDYLSGLANMNEWLLQLVKRQIVDGELELAKKIYMFVLDIDSMHQRIYISPDMEMKADKNFKGLIEVENAFFDVCENRAEFIRILRAEGTGLSLLEAPTLIDSP